MKKLIVLCLFSSLLASCASTEKTSDISANAVPMDEITKLESDIKDGFKNHFDVLAHSEFEKSERSLKEARAAIAEKKENRDVLNDVAQGRTHLAKAAQEASERSGPLQSVIDARQAALRAGAQNFPQTQEELKNLDEDLQGGAESAKNWDAEKMAGVQKKYLDLELVAITATQLGQASANIENAKKEGAESLAPKTLKTAEVDFSTAENVIATNRNEAFHFSEAVQKATRSADFLNAVVTAAKRGKSEIDEATAVNLVTQERKVSQLQTQLGTEKNESAKLNDAYAKQGRKLRAAGELVDLQNAIEGARKTFSNYEADVFQQGNSLLVRLKSMKFSNGRAELPADALPILAKVKSVALDLGPKSMLVEGHTDSKGDSAANLKLSQERAKAVANYFATNGIAKEKIETAGYGFSKPIASNKAKEGRAQNRRVDVIITPMDNTKTPVN